MRCIIISAGDTPPKQKINYNKDDFIICADGGYIYAKDNGIHPDIVIGDFDSLNEKIPDNIAIKKFNSEKDDTDTMLAIKEGISMGCTDFILTGSMGGRFDHTFANIQSLAYIINHGYTACIIEEQTSIYMIKNSSITITKELNSYISVFSYSTISNNVNINGLKYSATNMILSNNFPIGTSNEFVDDSCTISVEDGIIIITIVKK